MEVAERRGRVMASDLHLVATGDGSVDLEAALDAATHRLDHLERAWSRFLPGSDVSRINRLGAHGGGEIGVDPSTLVLLGAMVEGHQSTSGRYDPTVLRALLAEGYVVSHVDPTRRCELDPVAPGIKTSPLALFALVLDADSASVGVPPGLAVDPGGIGKGLAADLVVGELLAAGAHGAMAVIGGDLACDGTALDPEGWLVEAEWPSPDHRVMCRLAVSGGGVATSSTRSRRWHTDGRERHHQIDPDRGRCADTDLDAVTVIAPSGWLAEVHATAALAAGSAGAIAHLAGHGLSGIAVGDARDEPLVLATDDLADVVARLSGSDT